MAGKLTEIFTDKNLVEKIKKRLPYLFQLAELESSRAGNSAALHCQPVMRSVKNKIINILNIYAIIYKKLKIFTR